MLLLHGGSNANRTGLLVLQHVSEALEVGGKRGSKRRGQGTYRRGGGSRVPHQVIFHVIDEATQTVLALLSCQTHTPVVGTHFLSLSSDNPELFIHVLLSFENQDMKHSKQTEG